MSTLATLCPMYEHTSTNISQPSSISDKKQKAYHSNSLELEHLASLAKARLPLSKEIAIIWTLLWKT